MLRLFLYISLIILSLTTVSAAETLTATVKSGDCAAYNRHHPAPDVAFQPGVGAQGKRVAPADLPGNDMPGLVPTEIHFDIQVNPLLYGKPAGATTSKFANTQATVGHVDVDLKTGQASLNGRPLTAGQDQALRDACRK
ncbi:MAG TPA: hypothetical protein HPQ04_12420 [Rhodospirillaceae bacterium]|nr:hypothetical protein [Rhodospirillaceae bacterium]